MYVKQVAMSRPVFTSKGVASLPQQIGHVLRFANNRSSTRKENGLSRPKISFVQPLANTVNYATRTVLFQIEQQLLCYQQPFLYLFKSLGHIDNAHLSGAQRLAYPL